MIETDMEKIIISLKVENPSAFYVACKCSQKNHGICVDWHGGSTATALNMNNCKDFVERVGEWLEKQKLLCGISVKNFEHTN